MKDSEILRDLISLAFDANPADTDISLRDCMDLLTRTVMSEQKISGLIETVAHQHALFADRKPEAPVTPTASQDAEKADQPGWVKVGGRGVFEKRAVYERLVAFRKRNGLGCFTRLEETAKGEVTATELYAMLNAEPFPIAKWKAVDAALDREERKEQENAKL